MVRGKSLLFGLAIGGVVGATATLLSTPSSGKDLRFRAKEQSVDWKDMISNLKFDGIRLKQQITETSKEGAALIKDLTQEMKKSVQDWQQTVGPHQKNIHKYLEQIESSLKDLEEKVKSQ